MKSHAVNLSFDSIEELFRAELLAGYEFRAERCFSDGRCVLVQQVTCDDRTLTYLLLRYHI